MMSTFSTWALDDRPPVPPPREPQDERDGRGGVVDEEAVGALAMLAEALAVVGGDDDDRPVQDAFLPRPVDDLPDERVDIGDLAVVEAPRPAGEVALERLGGIIWGMRVVEMDPAEEAPVSEPFEPIQEGLDDLPSLALDGIEAGLLVLGQVEVVEVAVEALVQAPAGVEDEGADERARRPAFRPQDLGQGRFGRGQVEAAVVPDAVGERIGPGQDRGVRGQGQRGLGGAFPKRTPSAASPSMLGVRASGRRSIRDGRPGSCPG